MLEAVVNKEDKTEIRFASDFLNNTVKDCEEVSTRIVLFLEQYFFSCVHRDLFFSLQKCLRALYRNYQIPLRV